MSRYTLRSCDHHGVTLYVVDDAQTGRAYGPYYQRTHAIDLMSHVLGTDPLAGFLTRLFLRLAYAAIVGVVYAWALGVTPHELAVAGALVACLAVTRAV